MFKVRRKSDGLFLKNGGSFHIKGTVWKRKSDALSSVNYCFVKFNAVNPIIFDLEVVEYDLVEKSSETVFNATKSKKMKDKFNTVSPVEIAKQRMKTET